MIQIYGVVSSRAFRALWTLEELGVPYELVPTNFATGDTRKPEFLRINPNGRIPVLVDGDFKLFESMAINLYLAEKYGKSSLWPAGEQDRARAVQWSFWAMTECEGYLLDAMLNRRVLPEAERDEAKAKEAEDELQAPLAVLNDQLAGREYLLGPTFTVADLNVAGVLGWVRMGKIALGAFPNLDAWLARCMDRPANQALRGRR